MVQSSGAAGLATLHEWGRCRGPGAWVPRACQHAAADGRAVEPTSVTNTVGTLVSSSSSLS